MSITAGSREREEEQRSLLSSALLLYVCTSTFALGSPLFSHITDSRSSLHM